MPEVRDKIKALETRRRGLDADYQVMRPVFQEIRNEMHPTRGRFNVGDQRPGTGVNKRIIDHEHSISRRTLVAGLSAGVTSPSRPWFKLSVFDQGAQEDYEVKAWLHEVQSRMYDVLKASNIYQMFKQCYGSLADFGVFGGIMVGDFDNIIHTYSFPVGSYVLGQDDKSRVNTMHYSCKKTVQQLVQTFGIENVSNRVRDAFKNNRMHDKITVHHAIEPRLQRDPMSPFAKDMPVASYYWEAGEKDKFLSEGGYGVNNILAPRWDFMEGEVWPTEWPSLLALGDTIQLQVQHRDKAQAIQTSYKPPMIAPAGHQRRFRHTPGAVTTVNTNDLQRGGIRPAIEVRPDVSALIHDINETKHRISQAFFKDLFLMTSMSDRRQVTAAEIAERHEEKLIVLGPVLEILDYELLSKVIEAAFHYMMEANLVPDAPEAMVGMPIKVEYTSLLAQAQKTIGVAAIERTMGFAGSLAQLRPEVLDNLNPDDMLREFVDQVGPPPNTLAAPKDVATLRQQRAEAQAAAQQQEQMAAMADTMNKGAGAAKLLSEANERGAAGLQRGSPL